MNGNTISPAPRISILVCTRNRCGAVRDCIKSILANTFSDFEIVVVDQSDGLATLQTLASFDDSRIIPIASETRGLSRARNIAVQNARAPIVAFTDDDCICDEGWIEAIVTEFDSHPEIMGLFGRVKPWGDHFAEGLFCHCLIDDDDSRIVSRPVPPHKYLGHGNNMAYRLELFKKIGMYNPAMGAGTRMKSGEDTDMTFRALRSYLPIKYSPSPLVYHNNWNTHAQADRMDLGYVLGFVMVFGKFALHGDKVAIQCLRERLGELIKDDLIGSYRYKNWPKFKSTWKKIAYYFLGFFPAGYFFFMGDLEFFATSSINTAPVEH